MASKISKSLSISSWNVNGLFKRINGDRFCKLDENDFRNKITSDIVFMCETHASDRDTLYCNGYKHITVCRSQEPSRARGGLGVFIKHSISKGVQVMDKSNCEYIWLKLLKSFFGFNNDIYLCFAYIPPANSSYTIRTGLNKDIFDNMEESISRYSKKGDVIIMGDLNAHINESELDFILHDANDKYDSFLPDDYVADSVYCKRNTCIPQLTNTYGRNILDICLNAQLRILNGRTLGDTGGKMTFLNAQGMAIDDYCICSANILPSVLSFVVEDFYPTLSDHCPITLTLQSIFTELVDMTPLIPVIGGTWSKIREEIFSRNMIQYKNSFLEIHEQITEIQETDNPSDVTRKINGLMNDFAALLQKAAQFKARDPKRTKKRKHNKPWFDANCSSITRTIRRLCRLLRKNPWDKTLQLEIMCKKKLLRKTIRKQHRIYKRKLLDKLLYAEQTNPTEFWNIVNKMKGKERKDVSSEIESNTWYSYFKKLMNIEYTNYFQNNPKEIPIINKYNMGTLNDDISCQEVLKALSQLKRGKSCGVDGILNEMILISCKLHVHTYTKMFNFLFKSGIYPDGWRENYIKPAFKGGTYDDPSNFRGIALSSCLGKLFARILYIRLNVFLENNDVIHPEQIGFRKGCRTSDHIFTLKTIIDQAFMKKKYLYVCFVDLQKAFDSVNRKALIHKLEKCVDTGPFLNIIKDMYRDVRFSIKLERGATSAFSTSAGVKQGCPLSPTLFSLYVNDLINEFDNNCQPALLGEKKISCLLYADDLVLISESPDGLQTSLNKLDNYCKYWNLQVNIKKTNVMIFNKLGRLIHKEKFFIGNKPVAIASEYKYLGLLFKPSGTFSHAVNNLTNKAKKAMFSLRSTLTSDRLLVQPKMKLFDSCIKPIALYCSEVWIMDIIKVSKGGIEKRFNSVTPEKMHVKYLKNMLEVDRGAVNSAVLSELGRYPLYISSLKLMIGFWIHIINSNANSLINIAYHANKLIKNGFCHQLESFLKDIGFYHIWVNQNTFSKQRLIKSIGIKLQEIYLRHWKRTLDENSEVYCSKLRTYKNLKHTYDLEKYLLLDVDKLHIKNFLKIRISNSKLMVERGRHKNLEIDKRLCPMCQIDVETEFHFIMCCPDLKKERENLFQNINNVVPTFKDKNEHDKFTYLLKYNDYDITKMCVSSISNMYNERQSRLGP